MDSVQKLLPARVSDSRPSISGLGAVPVPSLKDWHLSLASSPEASEIRFWGSNPKEHWAAVLTDKAQSLQCDSGVILTKTRTTTQKGLDLLGTARTQATSKST